MTGKSVNVNQGIAVNELQILPLLVGKCLCRLMVRSVVALVHNESPALRGFFNVRQLREGSHGGLKKLRHQLRLRCNSPY